MHYTSFIPRKIPIPSGPYPHITFLIAARSIKPLIAESIESITNSCKEYNFTNYDIKVVADKDGELQGAEHIIVPPDYVCKSGFKARALNYALKYTDNSPDIWTLHLDEDAKIVPQSITHILSYIKNGGHPVANGPTVYPYDGNLLAFYAEAQRHWTLLWGMSQMKTSFVLWMNGSNMLVRNDIEHAVGWDYKGLNFSEDTRFAYEVTKKFGKVFGWHGGLTIEKPPKTEMAVINQRTRWFRGGLTQFWHAPINRWPRRLYSLLSWFLGFILICFFFLNLVPGLHLFSTQTHYIWIIGGFSLGSVLWIARHQLGLFRNLQYTKSSPLGKVAYSIVLIILSPIVSFMCTAPALIAIVHPPKKFVITEKG